MSQQTDAGKRIPKSLNTDPHLFGSYSLADLVFALFPGVVVVLITQLVVPTSTIAGYPIQTLTLPIVGVAILGGIVFVAMTPSYTSSLDWVGTLKQYYSEDRELDHEQAKAYTQIERVYPAEDAIERTDGAVVGLVQVDPPNMALATDDEWASKTESFQNFLNTVVEFPIQIFSTTQEFPVDSYLDHYESRLSDQDVKANPQLAKLIENYVDWYEADIERRQTTIRDHYVVVSVTPDEVQFERESLLWNLAGLPVIGPFVRAWKAPPIEDQRATMLTTLDERIARVEQGLREIEGVSTHRVSAESATELLASFWRGEQVAYDAGDRTLRTQPIVSGDAQ